MSTDQRESSGAQFQSSSNLCPNPSAHFITEVIISSEAGSGRHSYSNNNRGQSRQGHRVSDADGGVVLDPDYKIKTSYRNKSVVSKLQDYWNLKGLLLRIKIRPDILHENESVEMIIAFLENHTRIVNHSFWNTLSYAQKAVVAKRFTIVDAQSEEQVISCSADKPEVYVILSGKAHSQIYAAAGDLEFEKVKYSHGAVFGSVDLFNNWSDDRSVETRPYSRIVSTVRMCTLLRLQYKDFIIEVVPHTVPIEEDFEEEEFIMNESPELCMQDILCIRLCKLARRTLSRTLYAFLVEYDLLPFISSCSSFDYVRMDKVNSGLIISAAEASKTLFVVIDGSLRLLATSASDAKSRTYELTCLHKGEPSLVVKTFKAPLMILESGCSFAVTDGCFQSTLPEMQVSDQSFNSTSGGSGNGDGRRRSKQQPLIKLNQSLSDNNIMHNNGSSIRRSSASHHIQSGHHSSAASVTNFALSSSNGSLMTAVGCVGSIISSNSRSSSGGGDGVGGGISRHLDDNHRTNSSQHQHDAYHRRASKSGNHINHNSSSSSNDNDNKAKEGAIEIQLVFDRPTTYLAIPMNAFQRALDLAAENVRTDVKANFDLINSTIVTRLESLLPWMTKGKQLWTDNVATADASSEDEDDSSKPRYHSTTLESERIYGSFYKASTDNESK